MSHTMTTPLRLGGQPKVSRWAVGEPRLPDFLIIGACKAGTTTLWRYLQRHPRIFLLDPKEPDFFSRIERYDQGIGWYKTLFADQTGFGRHGQGRYANIDALQYGSQLRTCSCSPSRRLECRT